MRPHLAARAPEWKNGEQLRLRLRPIGGVRPAQLHGATGAVRAARHQACVFAAASVPVLRPLVIALRRAARMAPRPLVRLRKICLALPEAHEVEAWGEPTFRVRNKLFAMYASGSNHHGAGRHAVWCKAAA